MTVTDSLHIAHESLLGEPEKEWHERIYRGFPEFHGLSSADLTSEVFEATLILAIVQTYPKNQRPDPFRCFFFVRGDANRWAIDELGRCARKMFDVQKQRKKADVARYLGKFFGAITMGSRVLAFDKAPERWVSFGFVRSDPVPQWMSSALMECSDG